MGAGLPQLRHCAVVCQASRGDPVLPIDATRFHFVKYCLAAKVER